MSGGGTLVTRPDNLTPIATGIPAASEDDETSRNAGFVGSAGGLNASGVLQQSVASCGARSCESAVASLGFTPAFESARTCDTTSAEALAGRTSCASDAQQSAGCSRYVTIASSVSGANQRPTRRSLANGELPARPFAAPGVGRIAILLIETRIGFTICRAYVAAPAAD
jgi:hypothetical protein